MRKVFTLAGTVLSVALTMSAPARAETLPIEGVYPAGNDRLAALNTLAIGAFTGRDGQALAIELEQRLRDVYVGGASYFIIVPARGKPGPDATVSGSASSGVETNRELAQRQECAYRGEKGKCKERRTVNISCTRRIVTLNFTLTTEGRRREKIYAVARTAVDSVLICPDSGEAPPADLVVAQLASKVATELRLQFAPLEFREDIRVKEGVDGLQNNAKKKFKDGIRLTKRNVASACEVWGEVDQLVPNHGPTLFNLGLCAESRRDYNAAEALYRRVADMNRSERYAIEAIERLNRRRHAERQLAAHAGRKRP